MRKCPRSSLAFPSAEGLSVFWAPFVRRFTPSQRGSQPRLLRVCKGFEAHSCVSLPPTRGYGGLGGWLWGFPPPLAEDAFKRRKKHQGTMWVPVSPLRARVMFSGLVIMAFFPPFSR